MAKKKPADAPVNAGAFSQDEFQKLTPEEQVAHLQAANQALASENKSLAKAAAKGGVVVLPTVEDEAGNEYQWTAPTFTWDDNSIISVESLMEGAASDDEKLKEKAEVIIAGLIQRESGLLRKVEK